MDENGKATIGLDDLRRAMKVLDDNDQLEPPPLVFTRREAIVVFGEEAVRDVPDRTVARICGKEVYIVGDKWPMITTHRSGDA